MEQDAQHTQQTHKESKKKRRGREEGGGNRIGMGSAELAANRLEEKLLQATEEKEEPTDRPTDRDLSPRGYQSRRHDIFYPSMGNGRWRVQN